MKVLIIGSGGREHALVWKIAQSECVKKLYAIPGNPGTEDIAENVILNSPEDIKELLIFAKQENIDLTIVCSEELLAQGIVDGFQRNDMLIFGPTAKAAKIEWSKSYGKSVMNEKGIDQLKE